MKTRPPPARPRPAHPVLAEVRTPKYRPRIVESERLYQRRPKNEKSRERDFSLFGRPLPDRSVAVTRRCTRVTCAANAGRSMSGR